MDSTSHILERRKLGDKLRPQRLQQLNDIGIGAHEVVFLDLADTDKLMHLLEKTKADVCLRQKLSLYDTLTLAQYPQMLAGLGAEEVYYLDKQATVCGAIKISLEHIFSNLYFFVNLDTENISLLSLDEKNSLTIEIFTDCLSTQHMELTCHGKEWCEALKKV